MTQLLVKEAQQRIALLADVTQSLFASTGVFTRNHPHVGADLVEAAQAAARIHPDWRRRHKSIAKVAMGRRLAIRLYWM